MCMNSVVWTWQVSAMQVKWIHATCKACIRLWVCIKHLHMYHTHVYSCDCNSYYCTSTLLLYLLYQSVGIKFSLIVHCLHDFDSGSFDKKASKHVNINNQYIIINSSHFVVSDRHYRSPICRLIAAEDLFALMDALEELVPDEVHHYLGNVGSNSTMEVSYQHTCIYQTCFTFCLIQFLLKNFFCEYLFA